MSFDPRASDQSAKAEGALLLFSAGQDSATCLAWALERFARVETIGFDYGQRHAVELGQRSQVRDRVGALKPHWRARLGQDRLIDLRGYGALADSALTSEKPIETSHSGLPTTFVPGRNLVFFTVAAAHAYRQGLGVLVGGMCEADYSGYPDCRRETLSALESAVSLGLDSPISIQAPLMDLTKAHAWKLAHDLGGDDLVALILEHSHTCYLGVRADRHDWGYGCGACPACVLRARGWRDWQAALKAPLL